MKLPNVNQCRNLRWFLKHACRACNYSHIYVEMTCYPICAPLSFSKGYIKLFHMKYFDKSLHQTEFSMSNKMNTLMLINSYFVHYWLNGHTKDQKQELSRQFKTMSQRFESPHIRGAAPGSLDIQSLYWLVVAMTMTVTSCSKSI